MYKSAASIVEAIKNKETTAEQVTAYYLQKIEENKDLGSFLTVNEKALEEARELDARLLQGEPCGALCGVPVAVKYNVLTEGLRTTCASNALKDFIPPYDATLITRIKKAGGIILGKTNMDEFAMGSSSETSAFQITKNPLDPNLVPGGSSSGSASAVASGEAVVAIGTDTGGSIRQPASYCSLYGYYPSYGTVSRSGVISMANTLDQAGVLANCVADLRRMVNVIGGCDEKDPTSMREASPGLEENPSYSLQGKRIGYPANLEAFPLETEVKESFDKGIRLLEELGAEVVPVEFPTLAYALSVYNIIVATEVSSNMSRFDGIVYGPRVDEYQSNDELYKKTRSAVFGEEVQRRIAMGTLYLGSDDEQRLYKKAMKVRRKLADEYRAFFADYDFVLTPTTNDMPFPIGARKDDPMVMYDSELFTVSVNLCGLCAVSIPMQKGLGGSLQLIAERFNDNELLQAAEQIERSLA
jgi:aspartyl-tRNA(Asn)/glutamyl-tRNA(Gln) amidotransferase subunit A